MKRLSDYRSCRAAVAGDVFCRDRMRCGLLTGGGNQYPSAQHFDLILPDIAVAGCDPIGIIHIFRALQPRILVLVFTRLDENVYALPFIRSGDSGFLARNAPTEEITHALTLALSHRRVYLGEFLIKYAAWLASGE